MRRVKREAILCRHVHLQLSGMFTISSQACRVSELILRARVQQLESDEKCSSNIPTRRRSHTCCESQTIEIINDLDTMLMGVKLLVLLAEAHSIDFKLL